MRALPAFAWNDCRRPRPPVQAVRSPLLFRFSGAVRGDFAAREVLPGLRNTQHSDLLAVDEILHRERPAVVVARHARAVGARVENRQKVAFVHGELAVLPEDVGGFAHGAHNVHETRRFGALRDGFDRHPSVVEGGADEVRHGRVDDAEGFGRSRLDVFDPGEQDAGVADDASAGFGKERQIGEVSGVHARADLLDELRGFGRTVPRCVNDAEAPADVEMREVDAFASQKLDHVEELVDRFGIGPTVVI